MSHSSSIMNSTPATRRFECPRCGRTRAWEGQELCSLHCGCSWNDLGDTTLMIEVTHGTNDAKKSSDDYAQKPKDS